MISAQRFPGDFDGIIAGAPVLNFVDTTVAGLWNARAVADGPLTLDTLKLVAGVVYAKCGPDGVIDDPRRCPFDPTRDLPKCSGGGGAGCVTESQARALTTIYGGVIRNGHPYFPGQPLGADIGQTPHLGDGCCQCGRPGSGDAVGTAAVVRRQCLDQAPLLQPGDRAVQSTRAERDTSELFDVFRQRMPVLRPVREAGQDQHWRVVGSAHVSFLGHGGDATTRDVATQDVVALAPLDLDVCHNRGLAGRRGKVGCISQNPEVRWRSPALPPVERRERASWRTR